MLYTSISPRFHQLRFQVPQEINSGNVFTDVKMLGIIVSVKNLT